MDSKEVDATIDARPTRTEDRLLLDENVHRTANEITMAIAALRLLKAAGSDSRAHLLDEALERLEGFAETHRVLAHHSTGPIDAGAELRRLCGALVAGHDQKRASHVVLAIPDVWLDGATARRLLMIASELVGNAVRHALRIGASQLKVALSVHGSAAVLVVANDRPISPPGATRGTGLGTGIVDDLVRLAHGAIERRTGPKSNIVTVSLPLDVHTLVWGGRSTTMNIEGVDDDDPKRSNQLR